jgi:DNA polymerase
MDGETRAALLAALAWQIELGADEAIGEAPVDRFAEAATPPSVMRAAPAAPAVAAPAPTAPRSAREPAAAPVPAGVASADQIAAACATLDELARALAAFDGCAALRAGARSCVFADGDPAARVMVIGEAPGREEDLAGKPFVGRSGQLLDRMLAAIGLDRRAADRDRAVYITNVLPWRPVDNRAPGGDETTILAPFVRRHIELAAPEFLLLAGGAPARALLGTAEGIMKLRGRWRRVAETPAMPTLHPAFLLRSPLSKRQAWRDLLALRAALDGAPVATV